MDANLFALYLDNGSMAWQQPLDNGCISQNKPLDNGCFSSLDIGCVLTPFYGHRMRFSEFVWTTDAAMFQGRPKPSGLDVRHFPLPYNGSHLMIFHWNGDIRCNQQQQTMPTHPILSFPHHLRKPLDFPDYC